MNISWPSVVSNAPSPLIVVVFCLSAMLFPAAPKGGQVGEFITKDQITHELINSWWDSPMLDATTRTLCESVHHVVEINPNVGEQAFVAICSVNRSHAMGWITSLIVRPKYTEAREFINYIYIDAGYAIGSPDGGIIQPKVVDIERDGVSELVIYTGFMAQGFYSGSVLVVSVQGWKPRVLFEESITDCSGNSWARYILHDDCSFGSPAGAALEFEDLDGDGFLDLIETVTYFEGIEEMTMEAVIGLKNCYSETNDFKSCWKIQKPGTPVRDWWEIDLALKVGKTVNRYLFKNGSFVPL